MTWHVASRECAELGGHLARVESLSENRFLWQLSGRRTMDWWVDGTDELQEGSWIFGNGEPLTFTNWESGQPDNCQEFEHCFRSFPPERQVARCLLRPPHAVHLRMGLPVDTDPAAQKNLRTENRPGTPWPSAVIITP